MNNILAAGSLMFSEPNCPTRVGEIVENESDIYNIPSPRLGMQVFVKSEKKSFVITALKSRVVNGVEVSEAEVESFEPVGAVSITWNNEANPSNMNDFVTAGVYDIKGERTRDDDNLPIFNTGGGHTFNAMLTVLDSSITDTIKDDDKCITQILSFSNRLGQGEVYIRTGKGRTLDSLRWEQWSALQRNVNVGQVASLDSFIDNGIYSGVFVESGVPSTFVMIVINDYFIGVSPRRVSQFLYKLSKTGEVSYITRIGVGDDTIVWNKWESINKKELDATANELLKRIQGTSEKSDSALDAFKAYPKAFSSVQDEDFMPILDSMHGESSSIVGNWRMYIGRDHVEIKNIAIHYATDVWLQVFRGPYRYYASNNRFGIDSDNLQYNTYYRVHKEGAWSTWRNILDDVKDSIAELSTKINVLNGTGEGSIQKTVNAAVAKLVGNSPETLDTIQEISEWILNDETGAAAMATKINENADAIRLNYEDIKRLDTNKAERSDAMQYNTLGVNVSADKAEVYGRSIDGTPRTVDFPAATTERAGVMSAEDKKEQVKKTPLVNGDIIVGQSREIHSRNGKTVTDSFLARTTAGSGTIGDGVASLKSVGGNIVKNLVDGTFESGWNAGNGTISKQNGIVTLTPNEKYAKIKLIKKTDYPKNVYYQRCAIRCTVAPDELEVRFGVMNTSGASLSGAVAIAKTTTEWHYLSCRFDNEIKSSLYNSISIVDRRDTPSDINATKCLFVNLTEMYGSGNEPSLEECDKIFDTMDALPQGLTIAQPTEFKSTGFNQFNPDNVLDDKAIVDNTIVSGDKKIAVIPCLPCKVGIGENNGYCIHGDFGEDIKVYLTPLNPMEVEGELYMHELTKNYTTDTYVPQIKGYMLVEVPTTANLCAHFLWSEDKCERDSYEPYFESKVELPTIPEMPEYGLAGIQSSGTLACDEIDFERDVYIKRINKVVFNGTENWRGGGTSSLYCRVIKPLVKPNSKQIINWNGFINYYTGDNTYLLNYETNSSVLYIRPTSLNITTADALKEYLVQKNLELYYELETPEEYPLPKVYNNYISSDYGVEQFLGSAVPCNANNLYYMRSLAGETRNFLDRLYDNTDKNDAKEVADYITNGIESNKELATNAPNLALRALFVAAGAEYNDTGADKTKTAPWGEIVTHKAGHYYLNGLGDITEEQMMDIYKYSFPMLGATDWTSAFREVNVRTNLFYKQYYSAARIKTLAAAFNANKTIEIINFNNLGAKVVLNDAASWNYAFGSCTKLKRILGVLNINNVSSLLGSNCDSLIHVQLYGLNKNLLLFNKSNNIDKESVLYAIQNASPTSAITITLHADAYARLNPDLEENADIKSALEAQPLITLASA